MNENNNVCVRIKISPAPNLSICKVYTVLINLKTGSSKHTEKRIAN